MPEEMGLLHTAKYYMPLFRRFQEKSAVLFQKNALFCKLPPGVLQSNTLLYKETKKSPLFFAFPLIDGPFSPSYNGGAVTEAAPAPHVPPQVF